MKGVKLCIDCKWYRRSRIKNNPDGCVSPENQPILISVVDGTVWLYRYCEDQRERESNDFCGPKARWFNEK